MKAAGRARVRTCRETTERLPTSRLGLKLPQLRSQGVAADQSFAQVCTTRTQVNTRRDTKDFIYKFKGSASNFYLLMKSLKVMWLNLHCFHLLMQPLLMERSFQLCSYFHLFFLVGKPRKIFRSEAELFSALEREQISGEEGSQRKVLIASYAEKQCKTEAKWIQFYRLSI